MAEKRLIYFTSRQVGVYRWHAGKLAADAVFANDEPAVAEFAKWVASAPQALYFMVVDIVEEDFYQETIPFVRGKDRRGLLARRLAQRYRDLSLALTISLGYESGPRREERVLFSSFTNTQQLQPWLAVLRANEGRLVGVYSVALLAPLVGRRAGFPGKRYLLVSLQQAGLRQSYVDNGQIRFSRLGRVDPDVPEDVARLCALESGRIQQYLINMRILAREAGALEVVVLVPSAQWDLYRAACADSPQLRFHLIDLDAASRRAGLKSAPEQLLAERLFLHVLATSQPDAQFADDDQRRFYHLWRARVALLAAGAAVFCFCALLAGLRLIDAFNVNQLTAIDSEQATMFADQYARAQAQFPKMPTSAENLKALAKSYQILERQDIPLDRFFVEISRALAAAPQVELEHLVCEVGVDPSRLASAAKGSRLPAGGQAPVRSDLTYDVIEIGARVNVVQASDFRAISLVVNQFVEALRARPGMEVLSVQLPFDLNAEKSLSGDIGTERAAQVPRFTVMAARRLGT